MRQLSVEGCGVASPMTTVEDMTMETLEEITSEVGNVIHHFDAQANLQLGLLHFFVHAKFATFGNLPFF